MRTVLDICQEALEERGIKPPTSVVSNTSDIQRQLLALANRTGKDVMKRGNWQTLMMEGTFVSTALEVQCNLESAFPNLHKIVDRTVFNRTRNRRLFSLSAQAWQALKADTAGPAEFYYRVRGSQILFPGSPTAGETIAFEYIDKRWAKASDGTPKELFSLDTDEPRIDDEIFVLGVRWRFMQARGLEYGEVFREYEDMIEERLGNDKPAETLNMNPHGGREHMLSDGHVPEGSWPTS